MTGYRVGDLVHVAGFGKGIVREVRNHRRYLVGVKGRAMEVAASQLSALTEVRRGRPSGRPNFAERPETPASESDTPSTIVTLDLHGHTVDEALEVLERALNDALLAGARELRVIHGRSGGRIKIAVHRRLRQLPPVQTFRLDPQNPGVTIVVL